MLWQHNTILLNSLNKFWRGCPQSSAKWLPGSLLHEVSHFNAFYSNASQQLSMVTEKISFNLIMLFMGHMFS